MATYANVVNPTLNADSGGWNGFTIRQLFDSSILANTDKQLARVTFLAKSDETMTISAAYIGMAAASGDAYDFESTPTQITFDGGSGSKVVSAGQTALSDELDFSIESGKDLVIGMYFGAGTSADGLKSVTGLGSNYFAYYKGATNEPGTVNATSGYTEASGAVYAIDLVEAANDFAGTGTISAAMTAVVSANKYQVFSSNVPKTTFKVQDTT